MNTKTGTMIEAFRMTPVKGKRYNAIMATSVVWDHKLKSHRYFAEAADWRYMGTFLEGWGQGSGDGRHYWEHYDCDGTTLRLDYDYDDTLCFQEVTDTCPPSPPPMAAARIDNYIRATLKTES